MAKKAETPELPTLKSIASRGRMSPLDPRLVVDESMNASRLGRPYTAEEIEEFGRVSLQYGQLLPIEVRAEGESLVVVSGFRRALAAKWRAENVDPEFMLKVIVDFHMSEDTHTLHNIIENSHRKPTNAADDAIAMKKVIDEQGLTHEQVAELFNCPVSRVPIVLRLNKLNKTHLDAIRSGHLPYTTALDALAFDDAKERNRILNEVVKKAKEGEKVSVRKVRRMIQDAHANGQHVEEEQTQDDTPVSGDTEDTKPEEPTIANPPRRRGKPPRTPAMVADVRDFWVNIAASPVLPASVNRLGESIIEWLGNRTDKGEAKIEDALQAVFLDVPKGQKNANGESVEGGWM